MEEEPITNTNIEKDKIVSDQGTNQVNLKEESQNVNKGIRNQSLITII